MGGHIGKARSRPCILPCFDTANRLIIKLHDEADHLVAHCPLPYEFTVKANGNCVSNSRRRAHALARQQTLGPGSNLPSVTALEPILPEPSASTQGSQLNSSHLDPALRRLFPADGPTSGGTMIAIHGINFPPPTQQFLYVNFGNVAVPTV